MEKVFKTNNYGKVVVRSCMLELSDNTTMVDGIEVKGKKIGLLEVYEDIDIDELSLEDVENLIENNI